MVPNENDSQDMEIKIWCFNASYAIDYLTKVLKGILFG